MKARHKRLTFIVIGIAGLSVAVALIFKAFNSNMVFFFSPSDVMAKHAPVGHDFRLGGLVKKGSLKRDDDGLTVHFDVTDTVKTIPVTYTGILPDLFKEGKGVVAQGKLNDGGIFVASQVLAKHDENYMPPEVAAALKKAKGESAAKAANQTASNAAN